MALRWLEYAASVIMAVVGSQGPQSVIESSQNFCWPCQIEGVSVDDIVQIHFQVASHRLHY